jgi:hypothetical protein
MVKMFIVSEEDFLNTYKNKASGVKALEKYKHWFPVKASPMLAKIIAHIITDGHLQLSVSKNGTKKYSYFGVFSNDKEELKVFSNNVEALFGVKGNIKNWGIRKFGFSLGCIISNSALSRVLSLCGTPGGNKSSQVFDVPLWVKKSSNEIQRAFIATCFDTDGSIRYDNNQNRWKISFYMAKTENALKGGYIFLSSLRNLLKNFKVKTTNIVKKSNIENIRKDGKITRTMWFDIASNSIINFCKKIGSFNKNKIDKINIILKGEKFDGT